MSYTCLCITFNFECPFEKRIWKLSFTSPRALFGQPAGSDLLACIKIIFTHGIVKKDIDWSKPLHIGLDMNVDPMSACVSQLEKDKVFFIDEIVIYGSNTDEMCQEIKDRYGTKIPITIYVSINIVFFWGDNSTISYLFGSLFKSSYFS